ncbi:MAG: biopolymer transporter ExbD [Planctomycetota bacterium]|nr:biopolymer transporter ExbD [Planctomycetota bacterium]
MNFSRRFGSSSRLDPSHIRLPLIALIDVILFILVYFIFAGTIDAEEAELDTAIRTERRAAPSAADLDVQFIFVEMEAGRPQFRVGARRLTTRDELSAVLRELPTGAGAVLRVSDDVPIAAAAAAAQACKDAGFVKVSWVPTSGVPESERGSGPAVDLEEGAAER